MASSLWQTGNISRFKNNPDVRSGLFLTAQAHFLMHRLLAAPRTILLELDLPLHLLLVLRGMIIPPLAGLTAERDKSVGTLYLCHRSTGIQ
jgi:hypothetical protein